MANNRKKRLPKHVRQRINQGTLMMTPALVWSTAMILTPLIYVIILSFNKWNGSIKVPLKFVGLENFLRLPTIPGFTDMIKFTFIFAVSVTFLTVGLALLIAFSLDKPNYRPHVNRSFLRACWYVPTLFGSVAVGIVWRIMYNYKNGVINTLLVMMGMERVNWLETFGLTGVAVIVAQVWVMMGMNIIIFLAGIQGIDPTLYEAATIDGATKMQQRMKITIPMLAPSITINFITTSIAAFKCYELPYTISQGLPGYSTHLITQMIQEYAFKGMNYGVSSALSVLLVVIIIIIQLVQLVYLRKREDIY